MKSGWRKKKSGWKNCFGCKDKCIKNFQFQIANCSIITNTLSKQSSPSMLQAFSAAFCRHQWNWTCRPWKIRTNMRIRMCAQFLIEFITFYDLFTFLKPFWYNLHSVQKMFIFDEKHWQRINFILLLQKKLEWKLLWKHWR